MDIGVLIATLASLFLVIAIAEPAAARLRIPYGVMLACVGMLIGAGAVFFLRTELTDALNPVAEAILALPIRSNLFLYVFLPTLLFQVTLGMDLRRMLDDWVPILTLAIVAVVVATLVVGYALFRTGALPLFACLLIGSIVSTTDPSAVVGIFRSMSAPKRLARIIEGESLLNDAAAIALFSLFAGFVTIGGTEPDLGSAMVRFPLLIVGGAAVGWLAARLAVSLVTRLARFELAQISVSVALPYLAYVTAEQALGFSGVIAVVSAGLTLNFAGPSRLPPLAWSNLREVWDLLAHWAGALIFVLAALLIPRLLETVRAEDLLLVAVVVCAALTARAAILFALMPALSALRLSPPVEPAYRVAILWGGLRGAVTLALALAVTESAQVPAEIRRSVGVLATGFTLWTLLVQGTTLRWVIGRLQLDRLSPLDRALSDQVIAVAMQSVREDLARTIEPYALNREIVRSEAKRFAGTLDRVVERAEETEGVLDRDRITLGLITLAGAERDTILAHLRERSISPRLAERILPDAERLLEATRSGGRTGYLRAARRSLRYERSFRAAVFLHDNLRLSRPLAGMTAERFEMLLSQRLSVRQLDGFVDRRIRRIHGRRVGELLHEILGRRRQMIEQSLDGLRLQFPEYADDVERRFIRLTALRLEAREYETLHEDGLIGAELHTALTQDVAARRRADETRPRLDLAVQKSALIRLFPPFAELDEGTLRRLRRALLTRYVDDGELVFGRSQPPQQVFFLVSGAVELQIAGQARRLGRGEVFGSLTLLERRRPRAEARAITPCTLLVLDEARFGALLEDSEPLERAVERASRQSGAPNV